MHSAIFIVVAKVVVFIVIVVADAADAGAVGCQRRPSDSIVLRYDTADAPRIACFEVNKQFCSAASDATPSNP